jgi:multiple antibiotic resistance protein
VGKARPGELWLVAVSRVVDPRFLGEAFVTLFVIMDPLGTVPLFLALTSGRSPRARRRAAWQAVLVAFAVICSFALFGQQLLDYLGIGIPALQGAGGLLLLLVALELLTGRAEDPHQVEDVNVALVPLGTPLLAGPGAIVATIVFVRRADGAADLVALGLAIAAVHVTMWLALRFSPVIIRVIREGGIVLVTRIAGLLLSAIAVQLVAASVLGFVAEAR